MAHLTVEPKVSWIEVAGGGKVKSIGHSTFPMSVLGSEPKEVSALVIPRFQYTLLLGITIGMIFPLSVDLGKRKVYLSTELKNTTTLVKTAEKSSGFCQLIKTMDDFRQRLTGLFQKFADIMDFHKEPPGVCDTEPMRVHLTSPVPVFKRPYRHPIDKRKLINDQINELIRSGILEPSTSPYAAPVTLVSKKDGGHRLVADFIGLNANTVSDREPIPIIQDLIDLTAGLEFYSKTDIKSFFHHYPVHPEDRHKLAIITQDGHYQFTRVPFGYRNSPFYCQRQIKHAMKKFKSGVLIYQDDLLIHTKSLEEHYKLLEEVFKQLKNYNRRLKYSKCEFGKTEIEFLGHTLSKNYVAPSTRLVSSLAEYPTPQSVKAVRRFLGLVGWMRKFVPACADLVKPISDLLCKDTLFKWTASQQEAFQKVISLLIKRPVLQVFQEDLLVELHTDASSTGLAAVLLQKNGPVAYFSQKLLPAETRYSATELELLAVVRAVKFFRIYLLGRQFTLVTDHQALKWLSKFEETKSKLFRWSETLSQYDYEIIHP